MFVKEQSLLPINGGTIVQKRLNGTAIHSVNHTKFFVAPNNALVHTQTIERHCLALKKTIARGGNSLFQTGQDICPTTWHALCFSIASVFAFKRH